MLSKRFGLLWFVVFAVALSIVWQHASAEGDKEKTNQKWRYTQCESQDLARLGEQGWELVCVEPAIPYVLQRGGGEIRYTKQVFHLKQPK